MKKVVLYLFLIMPILSLAQPKTVKEAIAVADRILKQKVRDRLFNYYKINIYHSKCTVTFKDKRDYVEHIHTRRKLPKSIKIINFWYHFEYPEIDGFAVHLDVELDKDYKLNKELSLDFIPAFLLENKPSNFISADSAATIVTTHLNKENCEITTPRITYSHQRKLFYYLIVKKLTKQVDKNKPYDGELEVIHLNALTGNLEEITRGYKGLIIR